MTTTVTVAADRQPMDRITAIAAIRKAIQTNGLVPPGKLPSALRLPEMSRRVAVFQHRELEGRRIDDESHVETLRRALGRDPKKPKFLVPIEVWWGGNRWYVVDGHHRVQAYLRAKVECRVPVTVLGGTRENPVSLEQAIAFAAGMNSKDRLTMTKADKLNSAWYLTCLGGFTKEELRDICAVSNGSVGRMREMKQTLLAMPKDGTGTYTNDDLIALDWESARKKASGEEEGQPEYDVDEALKIRAADYRKRLHRSFGDKPHRDYEAFAMAMADADRRIPGKYVETDAWSDALEGTLEAMVETRVGEMFDYLEGIKPEHTGVLRELRELVDGYAVCPGDLKRYEDDSEY